MVDEGSWGLSALKMSGANGGRMMSISTTKQQNQQVYHQPPYFQFQGFEEYESSRTYGDDNVDEYGRTRGEKTVYRFLEECPPDNNSNNSTNNKDSPGSCLNNFDDNKSSNCSSSSTTQLSISIPTTTTTSHHHQLFPMFNSSNF